MARSTAPSTQTAASIGMASLAARAGRKRLEERRLITESAQERPERAVAAAQEDEYALDAECANRGKRQGVCPAPPGAEIDDCDAGEECERDEPVGNA
jgi:hypothetical protein